MTDYALFRQQLDAALRTQDFKQVQSFLIAQDQWSEETPADPEFAMWMMIAASTTLRGLHGKAREWLVSHGHADEALAVLGRSQLEVEKRGKQQSRTIKRGQQLKKPGANHSSGNRLGAPRAPENKNQ